MRELLFFDADLQSQLKQIHLDRFILKDISTWELQKATLCSSRSCIHRQSRCLPAHLQSLSERACEQIEKLHLLSQIECKGGNHAGLTVGEDGASHQCVEDLGVMRSLPNMVVLSPCDEIETNRAIKAAIEHDGPVYIRLGRLAVEAVHDPDNFEFEIGKGIEVREGNDVTLVATGLMVQESLAAAKIIEENGINARVIDMHTIKPVDKDILVKAAKKPICCNC